MSRQYASQLLFEVKPSKNFQQLLIISALVSCIAILLLQNTLVQIALFAALIVFIYSALQDNVTRELQWQPHGEWLISQKKAELQPGSVVTPFFASLKFKIENQKNINVIIFKDNIDAEKFRQLRVRMTVETMEQEQSLIEPE